MDDHMGPMVILGMKPDLRLAGLMEGQGFILQIVAAEGNPDAVVQGHGRDLRAGLFLLALDPLLLFLQVTAPDKFFLDLFRRGKVSLFQLFEQAVEILDFLLTQADLFLQIDLAFLQLAVAAVALSGVLAAIQFRIQGDAHRFAAVKVFQHDFLLALGIGDAVGEQQIPVLAPAVTVFRVIIFLQQARQLGLLVLQVPLDSLEHITADLPDPVLFFLVVVENIKAFKQRVVHTGPGRGQRQAVEDSFVVPVGDIEPLGAGDFLHDFLHGLAMGHAVFGFLGQKRRKTGKLLGQGLVRFNAPVDKRIPLVLGRGFMEFCAGVDRAAGIFKRRDALEGIDHQPGCVDQDDVGILAHQFHIQLHFFRITDLVVPPDGKHTPAVQILLAELGQGGAFQILPQHHAEIARFGRGRVGALRHQHPVVLRMTGDHQLLLAIAAMHMKQHFRRGNLINPLDAQGQQRGDFLYDFMQQNTVQSHDLTSPGTLYLMID